MYISNIGEGVESSLVAVRSTEIKEMVEISIQNSKKITTESPICLISSDKDFKRFLNKLQKEISSHSTPELYTVATLYCLSGCEILRVIKVDNDSFDVLMYYNYRRKRTRKCKDYVNLRVADLDKFIQGTGTKVS